MSHFTASAQSQRYWIGFKDKSGTPYSIQRPEEFLTAASVQRRLNYNLRFTFSDLPVNPAYISQVSAIPNTRVLYALKWLNGVVVSFDGQGNETAGLAAIAALPFVKEQEKVRKVRVEISPADSTGAFRLSAWKGAAGAMAFDYGGSLEQVRQLNAECLHNKGFRGQGITIAVLDAGFFNVPNNDVFDSLRNDGRLLGTRDFVDGGFNAYVGGDHGTMVLSCMAAIKPGVAIGTAPLANYWLLRTEEGARETISEEYNWIRGAEFADSVGADILTTSLGYTDFDDPSQNHSYNTLDGRTAPMSIAATMAARKGMFVLNAAGNSGADPWRYIGVPADADSICSVGAVNAQGERAAFSSVGPTADGRIKPDLMARGSGAWVCGANGSCFSGSGTSFATPVLAGAVACFWQANKKLNNIRVLNRLRNNASQARDPDNLMGWGIPDMCAVTPANFDFTAHAGEAGINIWLRDADYDLLKIQVSDLLGKILFVGESPGNEIDLFIKTPALANGIYIIQVESAAFGVKSRKILKSD